MIDFATYKTLKTGWSVVFFCKASRNRFKVRFNINSNLIWVGVDNLNRMVFIPVWESNLTDFLQKYNIDLSDKASVEAAFKLKGLCSAENAALSALNHVCTFYPQ